MKKIGTFVCIVIGLVIGQIIYNKFITDKHSKDHVCIKVSEDYLMSIYRVAYWKGVENGIRVAKKDNGNSYSSQVEILEDEDTISYRKEIKQLVKH